MATETEVFTKLIGKTITSINTDKREFIEMITTEGDKWRMYHAQDCCESVEIEDINGELDDLIGSPILMAEAVSHENETPDEIKALDKDDYGSFTWTFYKFATQRGYVTIRWYGSSNGYYSERVDFKLEAITA